MSLTPKIVNGSHEDLTIPFVDDREEARSLLNHDVLPHRKQTLVNRRKADLNIQITNDQEEIGKMIRRNSRSLPNGLNKLELEHLQRIAAIHEGGESGSVSSVH